MLKISKEILNSNGTIFLMGESGTGKSFTARKIHDDSKGDSSPFVTVSIPSLSESLMESELFGHIKGAFTGSTMCRAGYCDVANNGTLFLDEIGDVPYKLQVKLLDFIDRKKYFPVGSCREKKFSGRIIVATNRDIARMVASGQFREDLYYRLLVFAYKLETLRGNPVLLDSMIETLFLKKKIELSRSDLQMTSECKRTLMVHPWYGNIRELNNCLEYLVTCSKGVATERDLPSWLTDNLISKNSGRDGTFRKELHLFEKHFIERSILKHGGVNRTARGLSISKSTLIAKMRKYDINTSQLVGVCGHRFWSGDHGIQS